MRALLLLALLTGALAQGPAAPEDLRAREQGVMAEIAAIDLTLLTLGEELRRLDAQASALQSEVELHTADAARADGAVARLRAEVAHRVRALYRIHRQGLVPVLFGSASPGDLVRRARYLTALIHADAGRVRAWRAARAEADAARDRAARAQAALGEVRALLATREEALRGESSGKRAVLAAIRTERGQALAALAEVRDARAGLSAALSAGGAAAPPAPDGSAPPSFRARYGKLAWPVEGRVLRRFGADAGLATESRGIDIAAPFGAPVAAVFPGEVRVADYMNGYGQTVVIHHGPYATVYAHLNGLRVRKGARVAEGEVIGLVGNTGLADDDSPRLGFEIRYNSTPQDPLPWLAR